MDPNLIATFLNLVPARYALPVALVIIACKLATVFWKPPAAESRWAIVWRVVSTIALNVGWAVNKAQPGVAAVSVPLAELSLAKSLIDADPAVTRLHVPSVPLAAPVAASAPVAGPGSSVSAPPAF